MSENKRNCGLARDLMPLSLDGVCSESSQKFLDEHLEHCEKCRAAYEKMKTPAPVREPESEESAAEQEQKALVKSVKKTAKKMKIRRLMIILMIPVLIWACLFGYSRYNIYRQTARKPLSLHYCDTKLSIYGKYLFIDLSMYNSPGAYRGTEVHFDISTVDTEKGPVRAATVTLMPQVSPYIQWTYDSYYVYSDNINHANPVFCYVDGGVYTINSQNHMHHAIDLPGGETIQNECSFEIGVPVAMISITDGEYYEVLYTWGDELPEKNMETLSTTNPYDAWNHITESKILNPSVLYDKDMDIPLSGGGTYAGMNPAPLPTASPIAFSTSENQPVVIQSPNSKAQEVAQIRALQSSPTPIPEPTQSADDPETTQTPPSSTSETTSNTK